MSWSVSACGPAAKAAEQLEQQFTRISNCTDPGEQETVQKVRALVAQTLATIDPEKLVNRAGAVDPAADDQELRGREAPGPAR